MSYSLASVIEEINKERDYAKGKWPSAMPVEDTHHFVEWITYGRQYLDEAFLALAHDPGHATTRIKVLKAASLLLYGLQNSDSKRSWHSIELVTFPEA